MDLTEFLLERIADIEVAVEGSEVDPGVTGIENEYRYGRVTVPTAWVLAVCAANRRIVENQQRRDPGQRGYGAATQAVRDLAVVYADHSDYREEWRP